MREISSKTCLRFVKRTVEENYIKFVKNKGYVGKYGIYNTEDTLIVQHQKHISVNSSKEHILSCLVPLYQEIFNRREICNRGTKIPFL